MNEGVSPPGDANTSSIGAPSLLDWFRAARSEREQGLGLTRTVSLLE